MSIGGGIGSLAQSGLSGTGLTIVIVAIALLLIAAGIALAMKNKHDNDHSSEIYITEEESKRHDNILERRRFREEAIPTTPSPRSSSEFSDRGGIGDGNDGAIVPPWEMSPRRERSAGRRDRNASRRERRSQERLLLLERGRDESGQREGSEDSEQQSGGRLRVPEPTVPPRSPRNVRNSL